jgi:deoxycytidylate deaminase
MSMFIPQIEFPELFFGFVAPIGADHECAIRAFRSCLERFGYEVVPVKVSDIFQVLKQHVPPARPLKTSPIEERYRSYIAYGDQLRHEFFDDSFLAATAVTRIIAKRPARNPANAYSRTAYLLHQFKRREEIELLRAIYGEVFFQVSVYSRRGARVDNLARKFASNSANVGAFRSAAEELVQMDESEANDHGQEVGKIFHDADFIVNLDQYEPNAEQQIERFCELLFSSNRLSPSRMEHGMFLARAAALRSIDLSRQVGACVLDERGQVACLGANEVPKASGGTYWTEGPFDDRDYRRGFDSNEHRKKAILSEILRAIGSEEKVDDVLQNPKIKESRLMDALEYSRVIHAEMNAICDAARSGISLQGAILHCTTFPCHMCAKHIIASGLSKVVFLEPYPKSLASELHGDALEIEGADRGQYRDFPAVEFLHFFGVTPRRYRELFERKKRKTEAGEFLDYRDGRRRPLLAIKSPIYTQPESIVLDAVKSKFLEKLQVDETILDEAP